MHDLEIRILTSLEIPTGSFGNRHSAPAHVPIHTLERLSEYKHNEDTLIAVGIFKKAMRLEL